MPGADDRPLLLIGAAGLVGSHLRTALRQRYVVPTYHRQRFDGAVPLDLEDDGAIRRLVQETRPRTIVLAAAEAHVERCEREPAATRRINVDAARAIAREAERSEAWLVVFSSEYVFDGSKGEYTETDEVAPLNEYGRQKVELEALARSIPRHLVIRTSGVFGHEEAGKNFVLQLKRSLSEGRPFVVPSDQLITPTYAPSLAAGVVTLLDAGVQGTVHAAGPRIVPRTEFASMVCTAFRLDGSLIVARPTAELGLAAPRPRRAGLAVTKIRSLLGHDMTDPEQALSEMAAGR